MAATLCQNAPAGLVSQRMPPPLRLRQLQDQEQDLPRPVCLCRLSAFDRPPGTIASGGERELKLHPMFEGYCGMLGEARVRVKTQTSSLQSAVIHITFSDEAIPGRNTPRERFLEIRSPRAFDLGKIVLGAKYLSYVLVIQLFRAAL